MGVSATCQVLATRYCGVRVPRVWRFDSIERQRSALRGLGWSSPAFFKKHAPSLSTLACHLRLVVVTGADPGMTIRSLVDTRVSLGRRFRLLLIGLALAFRALTQHFFSQSFPPPIRSYTCASACAFTTTVDCTVRSTSTA